MPVEVILPKVDMDMATGQISRWFVAEGASVRKGEVLFEIETYKAAMEIDSPASGVIRDITGKERVDIPVGQAVAWIYGDREDHAVAAKDKPTPVPLPTAEISAKQAEGSAVPPPSVLQDTSPAEGHVGRAGPVRATPLARRLARAAGLDLSSVSGSGPNGRVVRADVEAVVTVKANGGELAPLSKSSAETPPPRNEDGDSARLATHSSLRGETEGRDAADEEPRIDSSLKLFRHGSYSLVPHDPMRLTIARRLTEAKATVPHFYLSLDCDLDALLALRRDLNAAASIRDGQPAYKLSVNDMVIKAWALALNQVPDANISWTEACLVRHALVDVGVAVSIPGGLITPIVRSAGEKALSAISGEIRELADRARMRKLRPEEYRGGTTSVSNLGMFGIRDFAAIINPPHATILAVGAGEQRAVAKRGAVVAATMMSVTLSTDHRVVDGALAADLLATFRRIVETPIRMLA